ncbi:MAG: hypothetical protein QW117_02215 [Candidatus Pacearchaeota archaeon]
MIIKKERTKKLYLLLSFIILLTLIFFISLRINLTGNIVIKQEKVYNKDEIKKHDNAGDCFVINGKDVYDITGLIDNKYFKEENCGKEIFINNYFKEILKERKVGIIS